MKNSFLLVSICSLTVLLTAQQTLSQEKIPILIRCDDLGMSHAVNTAAEEMLQKGFPVSTSVMFACPWYPEAVEILKKYPNASVGIHLTLNAEWKNYRWGPVSGASKVPTLVDSLGYFFPSRAKLFGNNPSLREIEIELRAQVERAVHSGLRIDYMDYHMGAAVQTLETRAIVERLAAEYRLAISRYFDEVDVEGGYSAPVANKLDTLLAKVKELIPGGTKLFVFHIGHDTPELSSLEDLNVFGPKDMSKHRQSELNALISPEFQHAIYDKKYRLINYRTLIEERGLDTMKRPDLK
ncbi:MAG: ChbG/HpnK family deacetylase [Ignavibacteriales bacterium]|nr:ChbG/HpnK family deacetylase [Ignavibacteriales bacterium]